MEFCYVKGDEKALHFGAFVDKELVCVASIYIDKKQARLRKFATLKKYQGKGVGTKVLNFVLHTLKDMKINYFWCDARKQAITFYENFGLKEQGDEFYKADVPYCKMFINL